jgi:AraC-like DNA-binding protein
MAPSFVTEVESELLQCRGSLSNFQSSLISDPDTLELFLKLHQSLERSVTRLHYETLMLGFFTQLSRHVKQKSCNAGMTGGERIAVKHAIQYLQVHYDQAVSLRDLATLAKMSPYYFHRVFCRATGVPPHAYQIQLRIIRAKLLLRRWPIASVAAITGFVDQSHFTRLFKCIVGVTPAQYANNGKKVQDTIAVRS